MSPRSARKSLEATFPAPPVCLGVASFFPRCRREICCAFSASRIPLSLLCISAGRRGRRRNRRKGGKRGNCSSSRRRRRKWKIGRLEGGTGEDEKMRKWRRRWKRKKEGMKQEMYQYKEEEKKLKWNKKREEGREGKKGVVEDLFFHRLSRPSDPG